MSRSETSGFSALSEAEARINTEAAQTQIEVDARDTATQAIAEAYSNEVMRHEANAMNETHDMVKAQEKASDREEAVVLNKQYDQDTTAFKAKVAELNEEARIAVFGTNGKTKGYVDPNTGNPLERPVKGIVDTMRENPRYGKTQTERDAAADEYKTSVLELVDEGFDISQAKVVMELRAERRDEALTQMQMQRKLERGAAREKEESNRQARAVYERKLSVLKDEYVAGGHSEKDAEGLAITRLAPPNVSPVEKAATRPRFEDEALSYIAEIRSIDSIKRRVQAEGIYTLDASENPQRPSTPDVLAAAPVPSSAESTEDESNEDARVPIVDPSAIMPSVSAAENTADQEDYDSMFRPASPEPLTTPPSPPEQLVTPSASEVPTPGSNHEDSEVSSDEAQDSLDGDADTLSAPTFEAIDEDDGIELRAYKEIMGEHGFPLTSYGVKFNKPGKVIEWGDVETVDGIPRMAIITMADGTKLFMQGDQLYDLNKARAGEDPLITEAPEGYEFPNLTIDSEHVSVEIALAEVEKHDEAKNLDKFTEADVDDPFDAAKELIANYSNNRESRVKSFFKEAQQRIRENRTERLIDVKRDVAAGVAGAAATAEAVDAPSDPVEDSPRSEDDVKGSRIKRAFKNAQQKIRNRISERLDEIEDDVDTEPESARITVGEGTTDKDIKRYLRTNGYVVNKHNLARVWDAVQHGIDEPGTEFTDDGMVIEISEAVRNNLILPKSRTDFLR
jgi:hypothetical protein